VEYILQAYAISSGKEYERVWLHNRKILGNRAYKFSEKVVKLLGLLA
jgi:hypothetical protein